MSDSKLRMQASQNTSKAPFVRVITKLSIASLPSVESGTGEATGNTAVAGENSHQKY
jgi:hypothetical protein